MSRDKWKIYGLVPFSSNGLSELCAFKGTMYFPWLRRDLGRQKS